FADSSLVKSSPASTLFPQAAGRMRTHKAIAARRRRIGGTPGKGTRAGARGSERGFRASVSSIDRPLLQRRAAWGGGGPWQTKGARGDSALFVPRLAGQRISATKVSVKIMLLVGRIAPRPLRAGHRCRSVAEAQRERHHHLQAPGAVVAERRALREARG